MLKKIGLTTLALAGMLVFAAPKKAEARTHFGIYVGAAPAYSYPVAPVDPYAYSYPQDYYNYGYGYPSYGYPAPAYVEPYYAAPTYGFGFGWGGHDRDHWRHEMREHEEHERHEFREHGGWRR